MTLPAAGPIDADVLGSVDRSHFEVEFVAVDGTMRRAPLALCQGFRFDQVRPARSFPSFRGQRNFPGLWWSSTMDSHVGYESWLERA